MAFTAPRRGSPQWAFALTLLLGHSQICHAAPRTIVPAGLRGNAGDDTLAARIIGFARQRLGSQVGDGECYDLADAALRAAGAKSAPAYGAVTEDADYVWGQPVPLREARPGDIVQFRDFNMATMVTTTVSLPDGRPYSSQNWQTESRDHHTAIVERNDGGVLSLLEQNVPPLGPLVQRSTIPVAARSYQGTVRVYRPQAE